jgi:hypothetical protein
MPEASKGAKDPCRGLATLATSGFRCGKERDDGRHQINQESRGAFGCRGESPECTGPEVTGGARRRSGARLDGLGHQSYLWLVLTGGIRARMLRWKRSDTGRDFDTPWFRHASRNRPSTPKTLFFLVRLKLDGLRYGAARGRRAK